jgi:hypothetical protein
VDTITIQQVITWGIPILVALVGATFAITKYSNTNALRVLEDRLKLKDDKIQDYAARLSTSQNSAKAGSAPLAMHLPAREKDMQLNDESTSDLASQIEALEAERDRLLSELSSRATASLDPRSELSNLLAQLKSPDKEMRAKAVEGLIALKDPLSFIALVDFMENHPDEAIRGTTVYLGQWFSVLIQVGGPKGAEYVATQTESTKPGWSETAFSNLQYTLATPELIDGALPALEKCALTHPSTVARTQAKLLIQHLQAKRKEYVDRNNAMKEHEQWMAEQKKEREQQMADSAREKIPSDFVIISALKDNDLNRLAREMIRSGQELKFWSAGVIIAEEYVRNQSSHKNCMQAIKQIVETAEGIAKSSQSFLLFLLSQMENESGDSAAAKTYLNAAREASPATLKFLMEHEGAFRIQTFTT